MIDDGDKILLKNVEKELLEVSDLRAKIEGVSFYSSVTNEIHELKIISPIEQFFYINWRNAYSESEDLKLIPQYKIGSFCVDFSIDFLSPFIFSSQKNDDFIFKEISKELPKIAIELDGHKFHEKTPLQVEKDKKRERFLISQGFTVIRFSGREIIKNAEICVNEVSLLVNPLLNKIKKNWLSKGGW